MLRCLNKKEKNFVCKNKSVLLQGFRNLDDGLWDISLPQIKYLPTTKCEALLFRQKQTKNHSLNNIPIHSVIKNLNTKLNVIIHKNSTKVELAQFLHGACFSPPKSAFVQAIKNGNFLTWLGLTLSLVQKIPDSVCTAKGHLNQERSNLQSTKNTSNNRSQLYLPLHPTIFPFPNLQTKKQIIYFTPSKLSKLIKSTQTSRAASPFNLLEDPNTFSSAITSMMPMQFLLSL